MSSVADTFSRAHARARHAQSRVVHAVNTARSPPSVHYRPCPCILLRDALQHPRLHTLFQRFNAPTLARVFEDLASIPSAVTPVVSYSGNAHAHVALTAENRVVAWGSPQYAGDCSHISDRLRDVHDITVSSAACAATTRTGRVFAWGSYLYGGDSLLVRHQLAADVVRVTSNLFAFAALKLDGSVVTWGAPAYGGDSSHAQTHLFAVRTIAPAFHGPHPGFQATRADGASVRWGCLAPPVITPPPPQCSK